MNFDNTSDRCVRNFPIEKKCLDPDEIPFLGSLPETLRVFRRTTGYDLRFVRAGSVETRDAARDAESNPDAIDKTLDSEFAPVEISVGERGKKIFGSLFLNRKSDLAPLIDREAAVDLARALAATLAENYRWRAETLDRETQLAVLSSKPVSTVVPNAAKTAVLLRDVLRSGARALGGFDAAALYLLNADTTELKLRAVWGLPNDRYLEPPRPLRKSRADVEALLGSAVILNETYLAEAWRAPEDFECSVCVPVASDSTILGTIWYFANRTREIATRELEILDLVAGRIAAELEKEALRLENRELTTARREWEDDLKRALRRKDET